MLNLYELLSDEDKQIITNYVVKYGINKEDYIGTEEFLEEWSKAKVKLYRALGNQFKISIPYTYNLSEEDIRADMRENLLEHPFVSSVFDWLCSEELITILYSMKDEKAGFTRFDIEKLLSSKLLATNVVTYDMVLNVLDTKKKVKIQKGTKTIKAIYKILEYFDWPASKESYESFRIAHSQVLNTKTIKGNLVISIHPMDFITMSDNDNDWSSCMNWVEEGCYRLGTVEMMNSNNVIVCYLENEKKQFFFGKSHIFENEEDKKLYTWNNKKWRQLFYLNKDIICSGKSYPYYQEDMTLFLLSKIKEIVSSNMGWSYSFGPQRYKDMITINDEDDFEMAKINSYSHKIIFNTEAMYHDFINDKDFKYFCYRNKVKKNRIISVSGKTKCLCCRSLDIKGEKSEYAEYNDRYDNTEQLVCNSCIKEKFTCSHCHKTNTRKKNRKFLGKPICEECYSKLAKKCPSCGQDFIANIDRVEALFAKTKDNPSIEEIIKVCRDLSKRRKESAIYPLYMCEDCRCKEIGKGNFIIRENYGEKNNYTVKREFFHFDWEGKYAKYISSKVMSEEDIKPYLYENLAASSF